MKKIALIFIAIICAGCATKQYPQAPSVTAAEAASFECKDVDTELAKARSLRSEIDSTGQFDGRTVLGVLGDFGIGNGMAKSDAYKKADARIQQLEALRPSKCAGQAK
ncbi:hypothetical protein M3B74_02920 [Citrobacter freundii]|uniref:hypothetical protein n=1 Tax=Citrobacter freundii TaxID=546 RepID=UPI00193B9937|nr:hypothetical protein [Citrobacter freundii]MBM3010020.1 hypothetical protein [Citrobacter freundii]MCT1465821.1 hypothetical protein [Citrobacter freundii]MCT1493984.1 hypothetical protein [Citrobacter freundii]